VTRRRYDNGHIRTVPGGRYRALALIAVFFLLLIIFLIVLFTAPGVVVFIIVVVVLLFIFAKLFGGTKEG